MMSLWVEVVAQQWLTMQRSNQGRSFTVAPRGGDVLLVVDVQNDFLPGGALAVPRGDEVVSALNRCTAIFTEHSLPVIATRDWHPPDHCSFDGQGGPWPPHCVSDTPGASFAPGLRLPENVEVVDKATSREPDVYSGFDGTGLADRLRTLGVRRVFVGGLATDYCVLATVLDALEAGFEVVLLEDAIRAVEVEPGDGLRAIERMLAAGAVSLRTSRLAA
jgi:nicotinamidase/pyrazinamidase